MECCCIEFDEYNDIDEIRVVKARKDHRCCECRATIRKGNMYEKHDALYDGSWSHDKTCARCANLASDFMKCGYRYGGLVEDFFECYGFDYREGIPKDFAPCIASEMQGAGS